MSSYVSKGKTSEVLNQENVSHYLIDLGKCIEKKMKDVKNTPSQEISEFLQFKSNIRVQHGFYAQIELTEA